MRCLRNVTSCPCLYPVLVSCNTICLGLPSIDWMRAVNLLLKVICGTLPPTTWQPWYQIIDPSIKFLGVIFSWPFCIWERDVVFLRSSGWTSGAAGVRIRIWTKFQSPLNVISFPVLLGVPLQGEWLPTISTLHRDGHELCKFMTIHEQSHSYRSWMLRSWPVNLFGFSMNCPI